MSTDASRGKRSSTCSCQLIAVADREEAMAKFTYFEPADLAEALTLLKNYGEEARIIAGGQSLLILLRQGLIRPQVLISLHRIPALREIKFEERQVLLGAMATQRQISSDDRIRSALPALAEAASKVGSIHVQNLGTVGGNISHAEPNGDSAPALISLGACVLAASHRGERTIPLDDFFRGPFENALEPDEYGSAPPCATARRWRFKCLREARSARGRSRDGRYRRSIDDRRRGRLRRCSNWGWWGRTVAISGSESRGYPKGEKISDGLMDAVAAEVSSMCDPLADSHGPAEYKRKMAGVFVKRALRALLAQKGS